MYILFDLPVLSFIKGYILVILETSSYFEIRNP